MEQSEQPKDVAQQPETTSEVKETVLAEATTEQKEAEPKVINFKELIPEKYKDEKALQILPVWMILLNLIFQLKD